MDEHLRSESTTPAPSELEPTIRRAIPEDAATLSALAETSKASWGYPPEFIELWRPQLTVTSDLIGSGAVWVAERDREPLGFYALSLGGEDAELEHLWVAPRFMGRGIGCALLAHALAQARGSGASRVVVVSDPNAEAFYTRMGAIAIGTHPSAPAGRVLPVLAFDLSDAPGRRAARRKSR